MPEIDSAPEDSSVHHWAAIVAGVLSSAALLTIESGIVEYFLLIAIGLAASILGLRGVRRPGRRRWIACVGLGLSSLELTVAVTLLALRLTNWSHAVPG